MDREWMKLHCLDRSDEAVIQCESAVEKDWRMSGRAESVERHTAVSLLLLVRQSARDKCNLSPDV